MSSAPTRTSTSSNELRAALMALWPAFAGVAVASGVINLLMLTGPLFMLQVYDRVLTSRSGATLVGLCVMALMLFLFQGALDALRARILIRVGRAFDAKLAPRAFEVLSRSEPSGARDGLQSVRDLDAIRGFLSGQGLAALFDLPWMPLYVGVCFMFHPAMGWAVLAGAAVLTVVTFVGDRLTRGPTKALTPLAARRRDLADATRRNAVLTAALGMRGRLNELWGERNAAFLDRQQAVGDITGALGGLTRLLRTVMQSGMLALGAWLVINQQATGGVMLAATILTIRALSPLETAIANWKGLVASRLAWRRLSDALAATPRAEARTPIPAPSRQISLAAVGLAAPSGTNLIVSDVSLSLEAGVALGVVGASGSGKSSLGRAFVGAWKPVRGVIRLDGATFDQFDTDEIGSFVGYLPQDVELIAGSVAENISRFNKSMDPAAVMAAARSAGVHDLIVRLPDGYETEVGEGGALLSGGQRQRIGLARALYGEPFLVVLDEPNSNLDAQGEQALTRAILDVRARGGAVVVIAHRPSALVAVDRLLVLSEGRVLHYGARDAVLERLGAAPFAKPQATQTQAGQPQAPRPQIVQPAVSPEPAGAPVCEPGSEPARKANASSRRQSDAKQ